MAGHHLGYWAIAENVQLEINLGSAPVSLINGTAPKGGCMPLRRILRIRGPAKLGELIFNPDVPERDVGGCPFWNHKNLSRFPIEAWLIKNNRFFPYPYKSKMDL